jgi:hypothetical protein
MPRIVRSFNDWKLIKEVKVMNPSHVAEKVSMVAKQIPGYTYGTSAVARSPITLRELELLKQSAGLTKEDEHWLHMAGEALADQTKELVGKWQP